MAKIVFVVAQKDFRDEELFSPKEAVEKAGHAAVIASKKKGSCTGMLGAKVAAEIELAGVKAENFDALVFVGGSGSEAYFKDPIALGIAKEFAKAGKLVCAICIAPMILANAGLLKGKKATCAAYSKEIRAKGAEYTGNLMEIDGKIITGRGPAAAREFGAKIAELLK